jgi:flagellar hook-basal body complex protein FliE
MISKDIFKMADQLKGLIREQQSIAKKSLEDLPDGDQKEKLKQLMKSASSGKMNVETAQREINKIIEDADTN